METLRMVDPDRIIRRVTSICGDTEMRRFNKGWYMSNIQVALEDINMMKHYDNVTIDMKIPSDLNVEPNVDIMSISELYAFNSASCCEPGDFHEIFYKRRFNNTGSTSSYSAAIRENKDGHDMVSRNSLGVKHGALYANTQNGIIMLSPGCAAFDSIRIVGKGFGGKVGDKPVIPVVLRPYIEAYLCERFFAAKAGEDPRNYRGLWNDWSIRLEKAEMTVHNYVVTAGKWKIRNVLNQITDVDSRG